jgi:hypothetical protein
VGFAVLAGALVSLFTSWVALLDSNLLEKGLGDVVGGNGAGLRNGTGRRGLLFGHGGGSQACVSRLEREGFCWW